MIRRTCLALAILCGALSPALPGCGDTLGRVGSYRFGQDVTQDSGAEQSGLWDEAPEQDSATQTVDEDTAPHDLDLNSDVEAEQELLEDSSALFALIAAKLAELDRPQTPGGASASAAEISALDPERCLARLEERGLSFSRPSFDTPLVDAPLVMDGLFGSVEILPRWSRKVPVNEVVDCRLALALWEMSRLAERHGIAKLQYYSTYRPLVVPQGTCPKGGEGLRCRNKKQELELLKKNSGSRHRKALAIDIRWVVLKDGRRLDVLKDYDRRDGAPPCDYEADSDDARLLQEFVCDIYDARLFNVMLTPNADKAHHNHFHFDLTPGADWYILR